MEEDESLKAARLALVSAGNVQEEVDKVQRERDEVRLELSNLRRELYRARATLESARHKREGKGTNEGLQGGSSDNLDALVDRLCEDIKVKYCNARSRVSRSGPSQPTASSPTI